MSSKHVLLIVVMIVGAAIFHGCEAGTATSEDHKAAATQPAGRTSSPPSRNEEADILDYAAKHPLNTRVRRADGTWRRLKYGDIALDGAEEALKDYAKPWTVKKVLSWYKEAKDGKTRAHLLRVLAASRHPKAAIELGKALDDDKSLDVRVSATYALLDYFAPDAGLNGGTESAMFAAAKWWRENRQRLLTMAATQPATKPAHEHWGKANNGLRARINASRYLSKRLGLEVVVRFENVSKANLAIDFGELQALSWKITDAAGKEVEPAKVRRSQPAPVWHSMSPGYSVGRILGKAVHNRDGRLKIGFYEWKLKPGRYSIHCLLSLQSDAVGKPSGQTAWRGKIELPPAEFEVIGEVSDKDLIEAGKQVRAAHRAGGLAMWRALAKLVRPGMTVRQMYLVLPPRETSFKAGVLHYPRMTLWNGQSFFLTYSLDDAFGVEASGVGTSGGPTTRPSGLPGDEYMVLTSTPRIKSLQRPSTQPATQPAVRHGKVLVKIDARFLREGPHWSSAKMDKALSQIGAGPFRKDNSTVVLSAEQTDALLKRIGSVKSMMTLNIPRIMLTADRRVRVGGTANTGTIVLPRADKPGTKATVEHPGSIALSAAGVLADDRQSLTLDIEPHLTRLTGKTGDLTLEEARAQGKAVVPVGGSVLMRLAVTRYELTGVRRTKDPKTGKPLTEIVKVPLHRPLEGHLFVLVKPTVVEPAATQPAGKWGKPYQGVSARLVMDRRTFALDQPMRATLELKKVADDARLHGGYVLRSTALGGRLAGGEVGGGSMYRGKPGKSVEAKNVPTGAVFFRATFELVRDFNFVPRINTDYQIDLAYLMDGSRGPRSREVTVRVVVPEEKVLDYYMGELLANRPREHARNRGGGLVWYPADELVKLGEPAVKRVAALCLRGGDAAIREKASRVLPGFGPQAKVALAELIEALKDENQFVRRSVVHALGNIGPAAKAAIPALTEVLKDKDARVREAAAEAIERIRGKKAPATAPAASSSGALPGPSARRDR